MKRETYTGDPVLFLGQDVIASFAGVHLEQTRKIHTD